MTAMTEIRPDARPAVAALLPQRLHHNAYVVKNQAVTNAFYEGVLGLPLVQFWIEDTQFEGEAFVLSHAFYGLQDGGALCFFCFSTDAQYAKFKSPPATVFTHLALLVDEETQAAMYDRLVAAGYQNFTVEHGYCRSLYVVDPDGLRIEFAADDVRIDEIKRLQLETAHDTMARWNAGSRISNNDWRRG